ncbi:hypothetical protein [Pedobacter jamesrossensis]|uniref:Uncharacterized protein n=1 Tax=Pedobacter jamesrossensis TaxID=1908238 RepID=A0ABV8NPN9_9SPHI
MYTEKEIRDKLTLTKNFSPTGNFVAISVTVNDLGQAHHSALIIRYNGINYYYHFDKHDVHLKPFELKLADKVFHKRLEIIDERLIASFLNHCKIIAKTAKPQYGYFYGGSFYENGVYHTDKNLPQLMTCVGFCINVLTGFVEEKNYLEYSDWQVVTNKAEKWFNDFVVELKKKFPKVDVEELRKDFRRIKPSELISSAYFNKLPIRKVQTDSVKVIVEEAFKASV